MDTTNLSKRRKELAITGVSGLLLVAVFLLLINVLANWVYWRGDLTSRHAYSLSPSSKKLVRTLDDKVVIKAYFTPDLPSPYNSLERYVRDLLAEYKAASHGMVSYEFMPTAPLKAFEQRAMEAGLSAIQFEQRGSSQLEIRRGFMGLVLFFGDRSETIPVVRGPETLEYDLTMRIAKMARRQKKTIVYTTGHGEANLKDPQFRLGQELSQMFDLQEWALPALSSAPPHADALFVIGPKQKFDEKSLWAIDQAVMKGTPTAFFYDSRGLLVRQFSLMPQDSGLSPLLKQYGVDAGDRLVADYQSESVGMTQNVGGLQFTTSVRYWLLPHVTNFPKDNPILRDVDAVAVPFAYRLEVSTAVLTGIKVTSLMQSSRASWLLPPNTYRVSPDALQPPAKDSTLGPFMLGALLEGTFHSYFEAKSNPVPGSPMMTQSPPSKMVVIGTSQMFSPELPGLPGTDGFLSNLMAYLSNDEMLLGIRSKGPILRPLKPISPLSQQIVKLLAILGGPALAVVLGIIRWRQRQRWRTLVAAPYAQSTPSNP